MTKDSFKSTSYKQYSSVLWKSDFLGWGNAKGKRNVKKSLRRYSRRKLNQTLT